MARPLDQQVSFESNALLQSLKVGVVSGEWFISHGCIIGEMLMGQALLDWSMEARLEC